jgi:hypothetical protein
MQLKLVVNQTLQHEVPGETSRTSPEDCITDGTGSLQQLVCLWERLQQRTNQRVQAFTQ